MAAFVACAFVVACNGSSRGRREWKPSDHQEPTAAETGGGDDSDQAEPGGAPEQPPSEAELARAAEGLFRAACGTCHGDLGHGDGAERPPGVQLVDLTTPAWQGANTDEQIATVIAQGRGAMPGFGTRITPEGIAALVRHVRTLRGR